MKRTKPLSITIAASFVYVAWLSMSMSGALQQIEKSAFAQDINFPGKFVDVSTYGNSPIANPVKNQDTTANGKNQTNSLQLNANEKKGVYTWVDKEGTNPTLNFKLDDNNVVQLKNPTDSKHQLILTSGANQVGTSGDILAGKSGKLVVPVLSQGETLTYHCLYHPTTMKGTVTISP
jgi:hypothetical protein